MTTRPTPKRTKGAWVVKDIRRATSKQYSTEEKISIVLDGLGGVDSIAVARLVLNSPTGR